LPSGKAAHPRARLQGWSPRHRLLLQGGCRKQFTASCCFLLRRARHSCLLEARHEGHLEEEVAGATLGSAVIITSCGLCGNQASTRNSLSARPADGAPRIVPMFYSRKSQRKMHRRRASAMKTELREAAGECRGKQRGIAMKANHRRASDAGARSYAR
jgi:hypothetical protein